MSFSTDSDSTEDFDSADDFTDEFTDDFAAPFRRPISVAQLLEREGFHPAGRGAVNRRTLTGVAAGAVLTVGAVVGGLFLGHGQTAPRDTLAAGAQSGGDIVVSDGTQRGAIVSPAMPGKVAPQALRAPAAPRAADHVTQGGNAARPKGPVARAPIAGAVLAPPAQTPPAAPTVQSAPVMAPASTPPASPPTNSTARTVTAPPSLAPPATTTPPDPPPPATTPPVTTPVPTPPASTPPPESTDPPTTDQTAPPTTSAHARGHVLGGLAGALSQLTQPGFPWFG